MLELKLFEAGPCMMHLRISNDNIFLSFMLNLEKINSHFLLYLTKRKKWNSFQDFKTKMLIIQI